MDCGQAVSHYIDRHAHLSTSGLLQLQHSKPITCCCSFWHIMFFHNQIIALLFNPAPIHYFCSFMCTCYCRKPCQTYPLNESMLRKTEGVFLYECVSSLQVFQGRLCRNDKQINVMPIDSLLTHYFKKSSFQKCANFQRSFFRNTVSVTRMCQFLNSWRECLACENSHKLWWICQGLDEGRRPPDWVMWLHIIPQNQAACALHTHLHSTHKFTARCSSATQPQCFTPS